MSLLHLPLPKNIRQGLKAQVNVFMVLAWLVTVFPSLQIDRWIRLGIHVCGHGCVTKWLHLHLPKNIRQGLKAQVKVFVVLSCLVTVFPSLQIDRWIKLDVYVCGPVLETLVCY